MTTLDPLQAWVTRIDRRLYMILVGTAIGILGGTTGLLIAITDPILATGFVIGILAGLYILTNVQAALYGVVAIVSLLPFATFPFRVGFTPTLLDGALGAFTVVYLFQWMTGRRRTLCITPVHAPLLLYIGWLILSFILGCVTRRPRRPSPANLPRRSSALA